MTAEIFPQVHETQIPPAVGQRRRDGETRCNLLLQKGITANIFPTFVNEIIQLTGGTVTTTVDKQHTSVESIAAFRDHRYGIGNSIIVFKDTEGSDMPEVSSSSTITQERGPDNFGTVSVIATHPLELNGSTRSGILEEQTYAEDDAKALQASCAKVYSRYRKLQPQI